MYNFKKIINLLTAVERRQGLGLLALMIVGAVLETGSIGLILPALAIITQETTSSSPLWISRAIDALGNPSQNELIIIVVCGLLGVYFIKTLFLIFLTWKQNVFIFGVRSALSQRIFVSYLNQPWAFYLEHNSAKLINILTNETNQFGIYALQPTLTLTTEIIVLSAICTLLVIAEPTAALIMVIILGLALLSIYLITRNYFIKWGKKRQTHESLRIQYVQEGLGGVKEIKLLGREQEFIDNYSVHNQACSKVVQLQNTLQQMPRLWLEFLAIGVLSILIFVSLKQGKNPASVLATIGLFAGAAFRLIPSVTRIVGAMQNLRYADSVVNLLTTEAAMITPQISSLKNKLFTFENNITFKNVSFKYPNTSNYTLNDISLSISKNSCVGFIGESGSGKSTIIDILLGLLNPTNGEVIVDGNNIQESMRSWQNQLGYVPQTIFLTDDTLRRNVAFGIAESLIDDIAVNHAIKMAQLESFVLNLPEGLNTQMGERGVRLSGGQRQRIGIARALYHDPKILVLDEATSALDTSTEEDVMFAVNTLIGNKTVIIVAHRLSTLSRCDKIYSLENGRILDEGNYIDISTKAKLAT
jgi:ABC-type multidrug transport system fused ATPase/permease subunit